MSSVVLALGGLVSETLFLLGWTKVNAFIVQLCGAVNSLWRVIKSSRQAHLQCVLACTGPWLICRKLDLSTGGFHLPRGVCLFIFQNPYLMPSSAAPLGAGHSLCFPQLIFEASSLNDLFRLCSRRAACFWLCLLLISGLCLWRSIFVSQ